MIHRRVLLLILIVLSFGLIVSTLRDSRSRQDEWRKEIWADQAGYYVYLPLVFNYSFEAQNFPPEIIEKTGNGFRFEENKVVTKYPIGLAILLSPFYLITQTIAPWMGYDANGFTEIYHKTLRIAAVFYFVLGLIFLFQYLSNFYKHTTILVGLLFLLAGTNVIYYMMEPGMSHVYSFSLFAILLYLFKKWSDEVNTLFKFRYFISICVVCSLIFNVRQLNLLFIPFIFVLNTVSLSDAKSKASYFLRSKNLFIALGIFFIMLLPQVAYNYYAHGTAFMYSYQNESFTHWANPKFAELLFSPVCGIFTYTPLHLVLLGASVLLLLKGSKLGLLLISLSLLFIYIYASWHDWKLGCSYGCRAMVDITAILALPLFYILEAAKGIWLKGTFIVTLAGLSLFNINLSSEHETCFFGKNDWDWVEYKCLIARGNVMQFISGNSFSPFLFKTEKAHLKACADGYVSKDYENRMLVKQDVSEAEKFTLIYLDENNVGIQLANGKMFSADASQGNRILANKSSLKTWERFKLQRIQGDTIALRAHNDQFVTVRGEADRFLIADATENNPCANFIIERIE